MVVNDITARRHWNDGECIGIGIPKWARLFRVNSIHFSVVWVDYIYWAYTVPCLIYLIYPNNGKAFPLLSHYISIRYIKLPCFSKAFHLTYLMDRAMNAAMCPSATHCMLSDSVQDLAVLLGPDADPPTGVLHWKCSAWHHYGHWLYWLTCVFMDGWSILNHQLDVSICLMWSDVAFGRAKWNFRAAWTYREPRTHSVKLPRRPTL